MAHPVHFCCFLFLAHPLLWGTSWWYAQRLSLILLLFIGGLPFYNFTWVPSDPFNSICLQSEPLVPSKTTLPWAFPTINTVTQTRTPGMVYPSPVHSCHFIYYCFLLPSHHSIIIFLHRYCLAEVFSYPSWLGLFWLIPDHSACNVKAFPFYNRAFPQSAVICLPYSINLNVIFLLRSSWWLPTANYSSWYMSP